MAFTIRKTLWTIVLGAPLVVLAACTGGPDVSPQLNPQPLPPGTSSGDNGNGEKNGGDESASSSSGGAGSSGGSATTDSPAPYAPDAGALDAGHDGD